ncbi:MAG: hypothetical protein EXR98_19915 [Gemmataceae bacterium]|nr:hypothetical protein [Gemmataceae bacterium]
MHRRIAWFVALFMTGTLPGLFVGEKVSASKQSGLPHQATAGQPASRTHERTERFDRDPDWDRSNNESVERRTIRQDFGFSLTAHAGGMRGEMGGFITPVAEPAYYAKKLPAKTFKDPLSASGTLACTGQAFHALICFFNAGTLNEWRTPNTIALRISGRGDVFYAWLEYATQTWRAGGDDPQGFPTAKDPKTGRQRLKGFASKGVIHRWTLTYDPQANNGHGVVTATIDGVKAVCHLADGHKEDGAEFNRFGLLNVMKSADTGGEVWLDDITVNGQAEAFDQDPGWEGFQNRRKYETTIVRPRFDFGFRPTNFAGGAKAGELGGVIYRGDCRYPERMAFYGDRLNDLTLEKPLRAAGKVCLKRGVSDSSILIGFFHSKDSTRVQQSQASGIPKSFLGISTDGPSREGFHVAPIYRVNGDRQGYASGKLPRIHPDGKAHDWTLEYAPTAAGGKGQITVTLDKQSVTLVLADGHKAAGSRFDRFGLITTWIDGNGQTIYFDDLKYTWKQE